MSDFGQHITNELSVTGKILAATPGAFLEEVAKDWKPENRGQLIKANAMVGLLSVGTTIAFKAAPTAYLIGLGAVAGYEVLAHTVPIISNAWNANTDTQRNSLADLYSKQFGRMGATMVDTAPGFIVGTGVGLAAWNRSETLRDFAYNKITKPIEFPIRERIAFNGRGVSTMPPGSIRGDQVDAIQLSDTLQPEPGPERMRSIDLQTGRASKIIEGRNGVVVPKFEDKTGRVMIHTQSDATGPLPGLYDVKASADFGIIRSGQYRSFYIGQKAVPAGEEQLRVLIADDINKRAFLLERPRAVDPQFTWKYSAPQYVDYETAVSNAPGALRSTNVTNAWSQFQALPKVTLEPLAEHLKIAAGQKL